MIDVNIQVSGTRGSGRTTVALQVAEFLASKGYHVGSLGHDSLSNEHFTVSGSSQPHADEPILKRDKKSLTAIAEAHQVIYGDREKTYGDPGKNLRTIAEYWSVHLKAKYGINAPLTPDDVCVMMVLLKQARLVNTPKHRDSIVDSIGYMALADRINSKEDHDAEVALSAKYDRPEQ